jgi:hypothetical protein
MRRLHLVAPEVPIGFPSGGDIGLLESRLTQHVLPVLDVHRLLLHRKRVIRFLLGLVVVKVGRLDRVFQELVLDRVDDVGDVLQLAIERPFAGHLEIVDVGVGNIGRRAGIEGGHGLGDHVLHGILRQVDLYTGLVLEFLDRREQRVVLGLVESPDPPHRQLFLRQHVAGKGQGHHGQQCAPHQSWKHLHRNSLLLNS